MVRIAPGDHGEVQRQAPAVGERLKEIGDQGQRKLARHPGLLELRRQSPDEVAASGEVDHGARQRLVERRVGVRETHHAATLAERRGERLAERDARCLPPCDAGRRLSPCAARRRPSPACVASASSMWPKNPFGTVIGARCSRLEIRQLDFDIGFLRLALDASSSHLGS